MSAAESRLRHPSGARLPMCFCALMAAGAGHEASVGAAE
jgi:hypothetical protein